MRRLGSYAVLFGALALAGCGGGRVHQKSALDAYRTSKAKLAVVSLYVNDYADIMKSGNLSGADVDQVIDNSLNEMLSIAESRLGAHFQVTAASQFGAQDGFQQLASATPFEVFVPRFQGKAMPIFADSRGDLIKSRMTPERAQKLCSTLGVDMVAVVYSEWQTKTGGIIPTTKPLAKTVLAIYDKSGEQLFGDRKDQLGGNVGAFSATSITEETIGKWIDAYDKSLQLLVDAL